MKNYFQLLQKRNDCQKVFQSLFSKYRNAFKNDFLKETGESALPISRLKNRERFQLLANKSMQKHKRDLMQALRKESRKVEEQFQKRKKSQERTARLINKSWLQHKKYLRGQLRQSSQKVSRRAAQLRMTQISTRLQTKQRQVFKKHLGQTVRQFRVTLRQRQQARQDLLLVMHKYFQVITRGWLQQIYRMANKFARLHSSNRVGCLAQAVNRLVNN